VHHHFNFMVTLGACHGCPFPHLCIICLVAQKPVVNLVVHWHCLIIIPVTTVWMTVQLIDLMFMPQNLDLLAQYSQAACPHVCSRSWLFTAVLTFSFSSHNSHGSLSRLLIIGLGLIWICCQCCFATWSMASFQCALLQSARAT